MPFVSRSSLGAEFQDLTSKRLLRQPEPQYLYAQLWKMALNASFENASGSLGWRAPEIGTGGAGYPEADADRAIFEDPIYKETFINVNELGEYKEGHVVRINRPLFANTTYTMASREVDNATLISTTPINLGSEQVSVTTKRFAGPYDQVNGNVAPFGVDRFDANKSVHSVAEMVGAQLQRDLDRTIDTFVGALIDNGATTIYANGYTADTSFYGGASTGGTSSDSYGEAPMTWALLSLMERKMDDLNLPTFADGKRAVVLSSVACQELKNDPQFMKMAEFSPPQNALLARSYYKTVSGLHLFKSTTLPTTNNGNAAQLVYHAQGFCPGVLGSGLVELPRVAKSSADNYGEWSLIIWIMQAGFSLLDSRFSVVAHHN